MIQGLKALLEAVWLRVRPLPDPKSQFEKIDEALTEGDYQMVLSETQKIIRRSGYFSSVFNHLRSKALLFNTSEEYNNYIKRHPAQSYMRWEYPTAPEAHYHRAVAYQKSGRLRSSREEIQKSLVEFPDSAKYLVEEGFILVAMKDYAQALQSFQKAIERDLTDGSCHAARAYLGLGMVHMEQADFTSARLAFLETRRVQPSNPDVLSHLHLLADLENDYRQRAEFFLSIGNYHLAVTSFLEALELNPGDFEMRLGIAYAYKELQNYALAEKHLKKAFQCNPQSAQVNFALGWVYLMQEECDKAEAEMQKAIRKNPYDAGYLVGQAYVFLDRVKEGSEIDGDKVMSATQRAIDLDPQFPEPHIIRADYFLSIGSPGDAKEAITKALRIMPSNQTAHVLAAEIYLELGSKKKSLHHLDEAADFGKDTEEMQVLRERLKGDVY